MTMAGRGPDLLAGSVDMTHGGGGRAMAELIRDLFHRHLANPILDQGNDAALRMVDEQIQRVKERYSKPEACRDEC